MKRIYWYRIREVSSLSRDAVQGWQTSHEEGYVLESLKRLHGDHLSLVYYEDQDGNRVEIFSDNKGRTK